MNIKYAQNFLVPLVTIVTIFQVGCSKSKVAMNTPLQVQVEAFQNVNSFEDLSLFDETLLKNQIREMNSSDSDEYDTEDQSEMNSGKDKILIVGDSWAVFPCAYGSMKKMLKDEKVNLINDKRCLRTSKLGIKASEWIGSKQDLRTIKFLKNNSHITYMYLSIGGNDLMGTWTKDFSPEMELKLFDDTFKTTQKIINTYLSLNPNLKIILSGYDFPHFKPNHPIGMYKKIFERMGSPSPLRINRALVGFTRYMSNIGNTKNIFYINHLGLAQYYDGISEFNFPARLTLSPDEISKFNDPEVIGGNINFQSSEDSLINWLYIVPDAFHLNHRNYNKVMTHTYRNVLSNIM